MTAEYEERLAALEMQRAAAEQRVATIEALYDEACAELDRRLLENATLARRLLEKSAGDVIDAVQEAQRRCPGIDIIYIHSTGAGGAVAAIVTVGTPAYEAIGNAYPDLPLPPHSHIEPGMF